LSPVRQQVALAAAVALAAVLLCARGASGQDLDPARVAAVKSGMIVNFVRYTTWPESSFTDPAGGKAAIAITLLGESEIERALLAATHGQDVGGRAIVIRRLRYPTPAPGEDAPSAAAMEAFRKGLRSAHVVFFGLSERDRYRSELAELAKADVLTVSDIGGFAEAGGMLGLVIRDKKVSIDANEAAIKATALRVSSQVLKLARIVRAAEPEPPPADRPGGGGGGGGTGNAGGRNGSAPHPPGDEPLAFGLIAQRGRP
jgi:hypothetical protein